MSRRVAVLLLPMLVLLPASIAGQDFRQELGELECARGFTILDDEGVTDTTTDWLEEVFLVTAKVKMPRLRLSDACPELFGVRVRLRRANDDGGCAGTYFGSAVMQLRRPVTVKASRGDYRAAVWHDDTVFSGSIEAARGEVEEVIREFMTSFATDYYEAYVEKGKKRR